MNQIPDIPGPGFHLRRILNETQDELKRIKQERDEYLQRLYQLSKMMKRWKTVPGSEPYIQEVSIVVGDMFNGPTPMPPT